MRLELMPYWLWASAYGTEDELSTLADAGTKMLIEEWSGPDELSDPWPIMVAEGRVDIMTGVFAWLVEKGRVSGGLPSVWDTWCSQPEFGGLAIAHTLGEMVEALVEVELLRGYQGEAVEAALGGGLGRGIVSLACGGGKTRIAAGVIACAAAAGMDRWLYVVSNEQLAAQAGRGFESLVPQMLKELGAAEPAGAQCMCMTYAGLEKGEWPGVEGGADVHGILVDEVHQCGATGRARALAGVSGWYRLGMSATPLERQDWRNAMVVGLTGPVVYSKGMGEMMEEGWLAKGSVSAP